MNRHNIELKDFEVNTKIKLAGLWIAVMFCYLYGDYFELYTPHKIEGMLKGSNMLDTPLKLFLASILMTIPAVMVCLSLLLKPRLNRWLNIIFGSFFTLMMVLIAIDSVTPWYTFYVYLAVVEAFLTFLIVRMAIQWPKTRLSPR